MVRTDAEMAFLTSITARILTCSQRKSNATCSHQHFVGISRRPEVDRLVRSAHLSSAVTGKPPLLCIVSSHGSCRYSGSCATDHVPGKDVPAGYDELLLRREALLAAVVSSCFSSSLPTAFASENAQGSKQNDLTIEDIKNIIENDFVRRDYLVTGDLTESIYRDNCRFQDPTSVVDGVKKYSQQIRRLFDSESSKTELLDIHVSGQRTIEAKYRISGFLQLPWRPFIPPYEVNCRYSIGEDGLIESYNEEWAISTLEAFFQLVIPSSLREDAPKFEGKGSTQS